LIARLGTHIFFKSNLASVSKTLQCGVQGATHQLTNLKAPPAKLQGVKGNAPACLSGRQVGNPSGKIPDTQTSGKGKFTRLQQRQWRPEPE